MLKLKMYLAVSISVGISFSLIMIILKTVKVISLQQQHSIERNTSMGFELRVVRSSG